MIKEQECQNYRKNFVLQVSLVFSLLIYRICYCPLICIFFSFIFSSSANFLSLLLHLKHRNLTLPAVTSPCLMINSEQTLNQGRLLAPVSYPSLRHRCGRMALLQIRALSDKSWLRIPGVSGLRLTCRSGAPHPQQQVTEGLA